MPRKPSRRLHERLDDLFTGLPAPEPDQGAQVQPRPSVAVPGGWLWESDLEGRYTWCSPELTTFLGLKPDQIVDHSVAEVGLVPESADDLRGRMTDPSGLENVRLTYRGADGGQVHVLMTADIRPGADGRPAGLRGVVQVLEMTRPNGDGRLVAVEAPPPEAETAEEEIPPDTDIFTPWAEHKPGKLAPNAESAASEATVVEGPPTPATPEGPRPGTGSLDRPSRPIRRRQTGRLPRVADRQPPSVVEAPPAEPVAKPGTGELSFDRPSRPVRRRTGRLSPEVAAEADAARLAVSAPQPADKVSPFEPAPLIATWGPATAYVDSGDAVQPLTLESPETIREPQIRGGRLLVPIRVQDEVMGVLAFEAAEAGRPWTQDDIEMAQAVGQQLGVTLQDARSAQLTQVALDEMREADRLKTQFLANMSHELRTPLNSIIGFSRVILKGIDGPVSDTQEQDLRAIHGAGLHLLGLINDILDVSKIEAGKMELTFGEVDLAEIVRGVMSTAVALVKEKSIDLRTELSDDLPLIQADSIRVRQVLLNLLSNAAKFTDQGYILVTARPIDEGGEQEILVSVEDTGPGITLTDQAKLFMPFSQVDASPTRKTGGTGLGLSICRHLVELHGGSIWVESTPGEGSVFYFTLPVEQALPEPEGGEAPLILAVDDNPSVLARYRSTLESLGYRFQALPQADGVVELATHLQPGVLVIDPHLPAQGSWTLIQGLRAAPVTRTIPIVLGSFAPESGRAFRLHAADVLLKPCSGADVAVALKRLLPPDKPSPAILLVDDESEELHTLQEDLAEAGPYHVEIAAGSGGLYASARRKIPDAILLNLFMARAEGFRALEVVRKDPVLKAIPLILLTSPQPHSEERRQLALYTEYLQRQGTASEADYLADVRGLVQAYAPPRLSGAPAAVSTLIGVECLDCGHRAAYDPRQAACPACGGLWQEARYDLTAAKTALLSPPGPPGGLWRYRALLPVREIPASLPMGEGGTPLLPAYNLGLMLGLPHLFIKDERRGPTGSFKDRQAAVTVAALREAGVTEAVVASTGNVALAYAAFCARVGIQLWAFLTSLAPGAKMQEVAVYGTQVIKVTSTYDQAKQLAATFAQDRGYYFDRGPMSVASLESMKTLSFEIAEQLASALGSDGPMTAPDWYVQAVSGGVGPLGVQKGFRELHEMGLIDRVPSVAVIQAEGCSPMVRAWRRGERTAEPLASPTTLIFTLSTGDPGRGYTVLRDRIVGGAGGTFTDVSDDEAYSAVRLAAEVEGISAEPAAGVAFAGLVKLAHEGVFQPDDVVVVNCSGHSMPVEESVLGSGWYRDLALPADVGGHGLSSAEGRQVPEEGLLAALASLDQRLVHDVLLVDDHEDARTLIRRILRSHGDFHIREAASGREALAAAAEQRPDLVVLDLMMPEMDGFAVLEALRQRRETANVPVVVVTAKELTPQEKRSLEGRISRLMTKGEFLSEDLLGEIGRALD